MDNFIFYFKIGWDHIISINALDHLMFIMALAAIYMVSNWKQVLILVTAFTIGHSLTLALSAYDVIRFNSEWIEFLIPLTIVLTALINIRKKDFSNSSLQIQYFLALFFGLIHGMGFANTIRFMLAKKQSIVTPLLSFNLGLEAGQILVVTIILLINYLLVTKGGMSRRWWVIILSGIAFCIAMDMCWKRWPL
ncbi:HupE/UreJ family protein [Ferruginibacter sp. HRS2-29]|nr:HupE/UreJ family protein [Ferruginibacter sp. HRS2-29]